MITRAFRRLILADSLPADLVGVMVVRSIILTALAAVFGMIAVELLIPTIVDDPLIASAIVACAVYAVMSTYILHQRFRLRYAIRVSIGSTLTFIGLSVVNFDGSWFGWVTIVLGFWMTLRSYSEGPNQQKRPPPSGAAVIFYVSRRYRRLSASCRRRASSSS